MLKASHHPSELWLGLLVLGGAAQAAPSLELQKTLHKTIVFITHDLDEAEKLADRILVMYRGRIVGVVDSDTPRDVLGLMMAGISYEDAVATVEESHE